MVKEPILEIILLNEKVIVRKNDEARTGATRMNVLLVTACLAAFLVGVLGSVILTRRLVRPITVLARATRRLGEGDTEARAPLTGADEVIGLAHEFNTMADRLSAYRASSLGELLRAQLALQADRKSVV